jgi:threonyl-tRNA synthetase
LRILPVAERHLEYIDRILPVLNGIRVDVDDREETVSKKIRDAGREWIPYVAVVGDKEVANKTLSVTIREESNIKKQNVAEMSVSALKDRIEEGLNAKKNIKSTRSYGLSERAKFAGG